MNLRDSILQIKGIGEKNAKLMAKLNIVTVKDLLYAFPRDYEKIEDVYSIRDVIYYVNAKQKEATYAIKGFVVQAASLKKVRNLTIFNVIVKDATGAINLTFFNQPYLKNKLRVGSTYYFRGRVKVKGMEVVMEQPAIYSESEFAKLRNSIIPKYNLTKGLSNKIFINSVKQALDSVKVEAEFLPDYIVKKEKLMPRDAALYAIHFPKDFEEAYAARKRLVFEELFLFVYMIRMQKGQAEKIPNNYIMKQSGVDDFLKSLPYSLTNAQIRTWNEINADLDADYCMNRMVQGDVGSGKTILAVLALLKTVSSGFQGALMAPTEVLARQHMEEVTKLMEAYTNMLQESGTDFSEKAILKPVLLVGSMTAKEKRIAYEKLRTGEANIAIGTHAIIQEKVEFSNLALIITDEQHRFGVKQREALAEKGVYPHVLVMSATPIPRSLAIILYGDMHLSVVDELPANRLPRKNCVVGTSYRQTAYNFIDKEVQKGHQAYVICPMVESDDEEDSELENVIDYAEKLRQYYGENIKVAYLHGRMKASQKNEIMQAFLNREIDVLVSTTVIEVGVNVPNATVMMVENAERFGLAGLHQLRGRVGRGNAQGYCIFVSSNEEEHTRERLEILNKSNDGFYIANEDLRLRGPGDLFGIRQSGEFDFKLADIYNDASLLKSAAGYIEQIMEKDALLEGSEYLGLKEYIHSGNGIIGLDFRTI